MDYKKACIEFVDTAFTLLYLHKNNPNNSYCNGTMLLDSVEYGEPWYIMSITFNGRLQVKDTRRPRGHQIITHSGYKCTPSSIPRMLGVYLNTLLKEHGDI